MRVARFRNICSSACRDSDEKRVRAASPGSAARMPENTNVPSISFSGGINGFTRGTADEGRLIEDAENNVLGARENCEANNELNARLTSPLPGYPKDCSKFVFTPADRAAALAKRFVPSRSMVRGFRPDTRSCRPNGHNRSSPTCSA